ncbi:MAG: hypothetical protein CSYNP_00039 [Syntrophus sp. SKADARSKE-3]|nr:hypothetical protein [Syntrophus sp. SKADARSKE-3]
MPCKDLYFRLLVHKNVNASLRGGGNVSIIEGSLLDGKALNDFVVPGCIVVNLAYLHDGSLEDNLVSIDNLTETCRRAKIKRLIHCSTAVVSGRTSNNIVTENTSGKLLHEYEIIKNNIEKNILKKSDGSFEVVILRPTAIFGKDGRNLLKLADSLRCGNRFLNYIKSCTHQFRRMNLVYIENVTAAIEYLIRADRFINSEIFIISDDEDPANNYRDIEKYLMARMGCKPYRGAPISLPFPILKTMLRLTGRSNDNPNLLYDCGKLKSYGFEKPVSFKEGLSRFSDWYIKTHLS